MVLGAAVQPPSSAPGCRSEFELNQSPVQGSVPASFKGPRSKTQGRSGGNYDSIERMFASQEVSSRSGSLHQHCFGGRVYPGRDFVSDVTSVASSDLLKKSEPHTGRRAAPAAKPHAR